MAVKQNVSSSVAGSVESPQGRTLKPEAESKPAANRASDGAHFSRKGFPSADYPSW